MAEFGAATLPPPHTPPHSLTVFRTWGWGGVGLGDAAQSVPRACSGSSGHQSSQSFAPGHQVQPRGRGLGSEVGKERPGVHPCPWASGHTVPGSPAERAPAPAFWVGEEKKAQSRQFPPSAPRRGPSADWPAPGRKLGLYLQLITPRPTLPPPSWRQRTTGGACTTPPSWN